MHTRTEKAEKKPSGYKPIVPAVDQALKLLLYLAENVETKLTLTEICERLGIHKSKGYTLLNTLKQYNLIQKDERTKTYCLGLGIVHLARNVLGNMDVRDLAAPYLKKIALKSEGTAHLQLVSEEDVYVVSAFAGNPDIAFTLRKGYRYPVPHGVHGKAIAAFMPEAACEEIISRQDVSFYGTGKPVDRDRLRAELPLIRKNGYAVDQGVTNPGITAICSPVFDKTGGITAVILLFGIFPDEKIDTFGKEVRDSAAEISAALGADIARCYQRAA